MPFFLLYRFLVFAGMLPFRVIALPSMNIRSLPQAAVEARPSLELIGNLTLPPSTVATTIRNNSYDVFPPSYIIPNTNPPVILRIRPTRHNPIDQSMVSYTIILGLNSLIQRTIQSHGDNAIPAQGISFTFDDVSVLVISHLPGTNLDLTYGIAGTLLRGVWELSVLYTFCELDMDVYIGEQVQTHYRGQLALGRSGGSRETDGPREAAR